MSEDQTAGLELALSIVDHMKECEGAVKFRRAMRRLNDKDGTWTNKDDKNLEKDPAWILGQRECFALIMTALEEKLADLEDDNEQSAHGH